MPSSKSLGAQDAPAFAQPIHLCLLDKDNAVRGTNYPVGDLASRPLQDVIRGAYGVAPHPDMPELLYERMENRLHTFSGSAGFYMCQRPDQSVFWISVNFFKTPNGRVVCHFPITTPAMASFLPIFSNLKALEDSSEAKKEDFRQPSPHTQNANVQNYRVMATKILQDELTKLDAGRDRPFYKKFMTLIAILKTLMDIDELGQRINAMSSRSRLIPYQLKLQAARLENRTGPLSVIATNHQDLTQTMLSETAKLQEVSSADIDALLDALAYVSQSFQADELLSLEHLKCCAQDSDAAAEIARREIEFVIAECGAHVHELLADIDRSILMLRKCCHRMRRWLTAMETTRMMCKIERAQIMDDADGLIGVEEQLQHVNDNLLRWMSKIERRAAKAMRLARTLRDERKDEAA